MKNQIKFIYCLIISVSLFSCVQKEETIVEQTEQVNIQEHQLKYPVLSKHFGLIDIKKEWARVPYKRLTINYSPCFGECPVYRVEFLKGGKATYIGDRHSSLIGKYIGKIDVYSYTLLCSLLERIEADEMTSYMANWTDDATITIAFETENENFGIADYGKQGPPELIAYHALFNKIIDEINWKPVASKL